ncbi:MAG TPA: thiamine pyrophosphate-dependent dehydrogenase E1 component subunit alpha [Candidatus Limnocylindrales bacterium]|nr:thiamine pyrophosphate-dependent dehydrogenase E1 component subunit alpha [Candidatus Limnocylindrales bacterium]
MTHRSTPDRIAWYRKMVEIRLFEEKVQELFMSGAIQGTTHLCQGQEAVSVGAIAAMREGDVQTNTYRGHGEALALGMPPETAFGELMGRTSGGSGGVGGSMHLIDASKGNLGANAIVGAGLPIAVGAAVSFQIQRRPNVALTFFGDGATNIGTFHEALNMAAIWKAPVVFIVVNNLYGEYSPLRTTTSIEDLARRADPYGFPGLIVDGQDVDAVHAATSEAVERARGGGGPTLLEMKTYRYRGHSRSDPAKYRPAGELEAWKARDPIDLLGRALADEGRLSEKAQAALRAEVQAEIDAAAERAAAAPYPTLEETRRYVYAD